jgi:cation transport ATPase
MLVIACPSALILATPTAMVAGLSAAARLGVLIKSVVTLEAARNLTAIVFDKTGTLTTGVLSVTKLAPQPGISGADLLATAATAEQDSRHPVARAVTEMARRANVPLQRLFFLNSDFLKQRAAAFAGRAPGVERAYALLFQRAPSAREKARGEQFLAQASAVEYAQVLLSANEFLYVD